MKYLNNLFLTYKNNMKIIKKIRRIDRLDVLVTSIFSSLIIFTPIILVISHLFIFRNLIVFLSYLVLLLILLIVFSVCYIKYYLLKVKYKLEDLDINIVSLVNVLSIDFIILIVGIIVIKYIGVYLWLYRLE